MYPIAARPASIITPEPRLWMERIAAVFLLIAAAPLVVLAAAAVVLVSGGAPLVAHRRVGHQGAPLDLLKLRTMWRRKGHGWIERIEEDVTGLKPADDARVTSALARLLRRHSIDELPQLWHVARGEMSLVGPRPLTRAELDAYYAGDTAEVLSARPGITGLWQVMGRSRLTYDERRALDLKLVRSCSAGLYWKIILLSTWQVISGRDAW